MTDPFGDLQSARATINDQVQQARDRATAIAQLAETVNTTSATVRSPRGEVSVTATAGAAISKVELSSDATALGPAALAALVTQTIASAQRAAAAAALAAAEQTLGSDSAFVAGLRADVESRFAPDDTTLR
jgi:DNA-binding protein YbaB